MPRSNRIAIVGFRGFERNAFESTLRLAAPEGKAAVEIADELRHADIVLADADDDNACDRVAYAGLMSRAVLLGQTLRSGAAVQLPRPIQMRLVMGALEALMAPAEPAPDPVPAARGGPGRATAEVTRSDVDRVLDELAFRTTHFAADVDVRSEARLGRPTARIRPPFEADADSIEHVLVLDGGEDTLRAAAISLGRLGLAVHLARDVAQAMEHLGRRRFRWIFADPCMEGLDARNLCRTLREEALPEGTQAPQVWLLTGADAPAATLQRAVPAADGCLRKPVVTAEWARATGRAAASFDPSTYAFADTAHPSASV